MIEARRPIKKYQIWQPNLIINCFKASGKFDNKLLENRPDDACIRLCRCHLKTRFSNYCLLAWRTFASRSARVWVKWNSSWFPVASKAALQWDVWHPGPRVCGKQTMLKWRIYFVASPLLRGFLSNLIKMSFSIWFLINALSRLLRLPAMAYRVMAPSVEGGMPWTLCKTRSAQPKTTGGAAPKRDTYS